MKYAGHAALCGALSIAQLAVSAFPAPEATTAPEEKVVTVTAYRVSKLVGMDVKNADGQALGKVNELVLDVDSGQVMYVALSTGGVLGVGDKLFAVPWKEFQLKRDEDDSYFVLNLDKAKLETAPGFDEENWPDVADENWRNEIDRYYNAEREQARDTKAAPRAK